MDASGFLIKTKTFKYPAHKSKFKKGCDMVVQCRICCGEFKNSPDSVLICNFREGVVHLGCCIDKCSWSKEPCLHCQAVYQKL